MRKMRMGHHHGSCSSSSSIDSSGYENEYHHHGNDHLSSGASCSTSLSSTNNHHSNANFYSKEDHLSTDLRLGLTISHQYDHHHEYDHLASSSSPRGQYSDWPPIKGHLRNKLAGKSNSQQSLSPKNHKEESLFVKVYMEGLPIGRKLDLLSIDGYHSLISTLSLMFKTTILYPNISRHSSWEKCHILTYEDKEGDWMMVGDVPWEMFLTTVKRLRIAVMDRCQQ